MTPETFLKEFGYFADAPYGVKKLRQMVLQLAVRGKLTDQNPHDEIASTLYERILAYRRESGRGSKTKKIMDNPQADEVSHQIPASWMWTRLGNLGEISPRNIAEDDVDVSFVPMALISPEFSKAVQTEARRWKDIKKGYTHFQEGDVCLAKITPCFQNGKSAVMRGLTNGIGAGTTELHVYRPPKGLVAPDYVLIYLKSPQFLEDGVPRMTGTAGQKRVPKDYFAENPFPLPPLAEQKRIVEKVDELMALCDELEARQTKRNETRVRLNNASLDALVNAQDPDELAHYWGRVRDNFGKIYDAPKNVSALKLIIMDLAVNGKLDTEKTKGSAPWAEFETERDDTNENAWRWLSLSDAADQIVDCPHSTPKWTDSGKICVRTNQFRPGHLDLTETRYVSEDTYAERIRRLTPQENDILYSREGGILGVACRVPPEIDLCLGQRMMLIRASAEIYPRFLELVLNSPHITKIARQKTTGGAAPRVNVKTVKAYPIPVPPVAEQERIVAKVDELMTLCNALESKLTAAQVTSQRLLDASISDILAV